VANSFCSRRLERFGKGTGRGIHLKLRCADLFGAFLFFEGEFLRGLTGLTGFMINRG
jgi:hypothetical protein